MFIELHFFDLFKFLGFFQHTFFLNFAWKSLCKHATSIEVQFKYHSSHIPAKDFILVKFLMCRIGQTSKMQLFTNIVNGWDPLTIFVKSYTLDDWVDSEYSSANKWNPSQAIARAIAEQQRCIKDTALHQWWTFLKNVSS